MEKSTLDKFFDLIMHNGVYGKIRDIAEFDYYCFIYQEYFKTLDLYCPQCKENKTFIFNQIDELWHLGNVEVGRKSIAGNHEITYKCPTCNKIIAFYLFYNNKEVIKVGQYPSLFDISRDELKKYQKNALIDQDNFEQIYKAEICASESYFVAAYTYMRRVYETLLGSVFNQNKDSIGITEEEFKKLRSDEKISKIKPYLAIDEKIYKPLYALLSVGIHSLSEEECGKDYDLLKVILLQILAAQKAKKEEETNQKRILELYETRKKELK